MPNGKGTADCHNCKNYELKNTKPYCKLWNFSIPRGENIEQREYFIDVSKVKGCMNYICKDYEPTWDISDKDGQAMKEIFSKLENRMLYAVGYPDLYNPEKYMSLCIMGE